MSVREEPNDFIFFLFFLLKTRNTEYTSIRQLPNDLNKHIIETNTKMCWVKAQRLEQKYHRCDSKDMWSMRQQLTNFNKNNIATMTYRYWIYKERSMIRQRLTEINKNIIDINT